MGRHNNYISPKTQQRTIDYSSANSAFQKIKNLDNSGNGASLRDNYHSIRTIYNLLMQNAEKNIPTFTNKRSPMIFISHSSKDKEFVEALVNLLECMVWINQIFFVAR